MRLGFVSDTHEMHDVLTEQLRPLGLDVLVHCGDFTGKGALAKVQAFADWCSVLRTEGIAEHVIVIAGNHDVSFDATHPAVRPDVATWCRAELENAGVVYLQDQAYVIGDVKFYGSPWTPRFFDWAFQIDTEEQAERVFGKIPDDVDVLVTHGPPYGVRDRAPDGRLCGSRALKRTVEKLRPRVHAFGHIHEGYGSESDKTTTYINASTCTGHYRPINPPIVIEI